MYKKLLLASCLLSIGYAASYERPENYGWSSSRIADNKHALSDIPVKWQGSGKGQVRLLYQHYQQVHGIPYPPRDQGEAPSCVGQATAAACDILAAVQIAEGARERAPPGNASAATIYGWSRVKIGQINTRRFGAGSHCAWAASAVQKYGVVANTHYREIGIDLSSPSPQRAIEYGLNGVPQPLEAIGQEHIVVEFIKVKSFNEVRDAIYQGCPVIIGSDVGFGDKNGARRDDDGFLNRPKNLMGLQKSRWNHAMVIIAMKDDERPGGLILNSWGPDWISGPKHYLDEPEGAFWADAEDIDEICSQDDSYAIRFFIGYTSYDFWSD